MRSKINQLTSLFSLRPRKTPTVLQMEAVECGAAALGIILAHHGSYIPLEELRYECGVSRDGSKASNLVRAARKYGFTAKGYRREPNKLPELPLPAIIHWNFNHFLVLEGIRNNTVYLNDPAMGPRRVSVEELDEAFTGVILTFEPNESYEPTGKKPSIIHLLANRLKGTQSAVALIFLISLALIIPGVLLPAFTRIFVDFYLMQGQTAWLVPLLIGLSITAALRTILTWMQQRYLLRMEMKLSLTNSSQLFWHILRLPMNFFFQRSAGDISARIGQNDRVAQLLSGQLATTLLNLVVLVFYAALMLSYSIPLTFVGVLMAVLNFVALRTVSRKRIDTNMRMVESQGKLQSNTFSSLQQIETIKSTGAENDAFAKWGGYQAKAVNAIQELGATTQILNVVPIFLNHLATIILLIVGGYFIVRGDMTIGMLVAFQTLMSSFLAPVGQLVNLGGQIQEIEGIINRLNDVLNHEPDPMAEILSTTRLDQSLEKLPGKLELRELTFGYSLLAPPLIEDFSLTLEPGTRVALVGGSGSGKSTIAKIVAGLYKPWQGEVLFDGKYRTAYPRAILNNSLRMVDQEIFLFEGTIKDNITMWDEHIPEENIIRATQDAQIEDVITSRQNSYQSVVEEAGRNFSGGQRQRLEIARALVTNPSILILDEATRALDPTTEQLIDHQLRQRGCTCLIIAHRLSTIRDCDEIIVLDKGKVVERGTHETLWQKGSKYEQLIRQETPETEMVMEDIWESLSA